MKKLSLLTLLASAALLPLAAQASDDYAGVSIGRVEHKVKVDRVGELKDNDTGYKFYFGHKITDTFALEVGYAGLGKGEISGGGRSVSAEPRSINAAVVATFPINPKFALFGKVGFSQNRTRVSASGVGSFKENDTNTLLGVGGTFQFSPNMAVVVEFEDFSKTIGDRSVQLKNNMLSAGIRFGF